MTPEGCSIPVYPAAPVRRRRLPDGRPVVVRPLEAEDTHRYTEFVRGLSAETLYNRLLGSGVGITPDRLQRLLVVDQHSHVALDAVIRLDGGAEQIVGVARFAGTGDDCVAEFAVTVADEWQGKGVGTLLLRALLLEARRAGVHTLVGDVFRANAPMHALLRNAGFGLAVAPGDAQLTRATKALAPVRPRARSARTAPRRAPAPRARRR